MTNQTTSKITSIDDAPVTDAAAGTPAEVAVAGELIQHNEALSGVRKILTIHPEGGEGGNTAVFIGLNGVGFQVPRGKPWNVPVELVNNLDNAEQTIYERNDKGEMIPRVAPRFAYTVRDTAPVGKAKEAAEAAKVATQPKK